MSVSRSGDELGEMKGVSCTDPKMADGKGLEKVPSGVRGLDEITFGGLPKGRPILVSGGPGCGKTLLAMEFVARGFVDYGEPGVFVAFEEKVPDLEKNFASLGFDLPGLVAQERRDLAEQALSDEEIAQRERELETKRRLMESEVAAIQARYVREEQELAAYVDQQRLKREAAERTAETLAAQRRAD